MPIVVNDSAMRFGVIANHVLADSLTATFIVKGSFSLRPDGEVEKLPEDDHPHLDGDAPWDDDPARGLRRASDFAPFKPGTDLLVAAHCYTPGRRPEPSVPVSFSVGGFRKTALIVGDRMMLRDVSGPILTDPVPFRSMSLDWSRAYGGPSFPRNPLGRGADENAVIDGRVVRLAPNIQSLDRRGAESLHTLAPVGFGPLSPEWPQRFSRIGTFDASWLAERWPWYPADFDWRYFNAAPPDQYLDGIYLKGDEPLEFVNLHPEHAVLRSRLAGVRVRCFYRRRRGTELDFVEVPLRLDTLFADLDVGQVHLTWRGVSRAATVKLKEFEEFYVLDEPINRPFGGPTDDYLQMYEARRREIAKEFEIPPVVIDYPVMPEIAPLSTAWAERLDAQIKELRAQANADEIWPFAVTGPTGAALPTMKVPPLPPIPMTNAAAKAILKADEAKFAEMDPRIPAAYPFPDLSEFEDADEEEAPGEEQEAEPIRPGDWTRERVIDHLARSGAFVREDLAGLDLSNLTFDRLDMTRASLDGCDLRGATFAGTNLTGASLRESRFEGALLEAATLDDADLSSIEADGVSFRGASLRDADLTEAKLNGAGFDGAQATRAIFCGAALSKATFREALLDRADFSGGDLVEADFSRSSLVGTEIEHCNARGARFAGARAENLRASKSSLEGASFRQCHADGAILEEAYLSNADFREVHLRKAILTGARLCGAVFALADLREARLDDVDATGATFVGVNLFRASLEAARLDRATFENCNLFQAELYQISTEKTRFHDVNFKGTKREA
jgi:uncharacterized protein YjbI with pentapeptide repeats